MKKYLFLAFIALFFVTSHSAWATNVYVKATANNGTVSWISINGYINGENIGIGNGSSRAIDENTKGSIDLRQVWSQSGGKGTLYQVTSIRNYAFGGCSDLTSVTIPNSVTSIGNKAFQRCTGLTSVTIPSSVTSIGEQVFEGCTGLTSVTIPSSVTSIGNGAFWGCTGLTSVTIPNSVTSIGRYAFSGCTGLTSISIPNSINIIESRTFAGCTNLTYIGIPNSVGIIRMSAFDGCSNLTAIYIPKSVDTIDRESNDDSETFYGISQWGDRREYEYSIFYGCESLTSITVDEFNNNFTSIDGVLYSKD